MAFRKPNRLCGLLVTLVGLGIAGQAQAHHRDFTFIRDWYLPYVGEKEIEARTTIEDRTKAVQQEFEFELGITKHFAIEPGVGFHEEPGEKTHLDEWDVELRFNFLDFAYNQVLPALNVEYENPIDTGEAKHGELKFIASLYTPKGENFSVNLNVGQELNHDKEKESEFLFGYSRPIGPVLDEEGHGLRGGFEYQQDLMEHHAWLGPVLSYRANSHLNAVATYMFRLNHRDEINNLLKFILEWEF